jgi:hypothetical protein
MIEISAEIRPSMALELEVHGGQKDQSPLTPDNLYALAKSGPSWAVRLDGKLVAVGGHTPIWAGRTVLWGYLGADCGLALPTMTKRIRREVQALTVEFPRIEAYADRNHEPSNRWLRLLGLKKEGVMRKFANGRDYVLYAKVT